MKKQIVFDEEEYNNLTFKLIDQIIEDSKKGWGIRFLSRETGNEESENSIKGQLIISINKILGYNG